MTKNKRSANSVVYRLEYALGMMLVAHEELRKFAHDIAPTPNDVIRQMDRRLFFAKKEHRDAP
jgi:hypothetical protein